MKTQEIAEQLYLDALISYPRTNSQKLPPTLNYKAILSKLGENREYRDLVTRLLSETKGFLKPREGEKKTSHTQLFIQPVFNQENYPKNKKLSTT